MHHRTCKSCSLKLNKYEFFSRTNEDSLSFVLKKRQRFNKHLNKDQPNINHKNIRDKTINSFEL